SSSSPLLAAARFLRHRLPLFRWRSCHRSKGVRFGARSVMWPAWPAVLRSGATVVPQWARVAAVLRTCGRGATSGEGEDAVAAQISA
ncbi:unnamed protein product, partial [Urochloa humidicola]